MEALVTAFDDALTRLGSSHTHEDLLKAYGVVHSHSTPAQTAPLEECAFYDLFMANPSDLNKHYDDVRAEARRVHGDAHVDAILKGNRHDPLKARRSGDYRLDAQQRRALSRDGVTLVDSKIRTFGDAYNDLYHDDMPVFITADSVLHAWHTSFDVFYMDTEMTSLYPLLKHVLARTFDAADTFCTAYEQDAFVGPLAADVRDYVMVALSLIQGKVPANATKQVKALWTAIQTKQTTEIEVCGRRRVMDMSMMEPRGHYTKSRTLELYFQAFMWLALVEFGVDGSRDPAVDLYQLRAVCCLMHLLRTAEVANVLAALESTLDSLVGSGYGPDSLTPSKLDKLLPQDFCIENLRDETLCKALQSKIRLSGAAVQAVNGQIRDEGTATDATALPLAFVTIGQYAAWDAFALSRVVFDRVRHCDTKVVRTLPSAVDVAFTVLANDAAILEIAKRMTSTPSEPDFVPFRDGLPYASNLMALRQVLDNETAQVDTTSASLTTLWILALRELSQPSANASTSCQTSTWKVRMMNAQIGSYMQLKHDTILTAKQPLTFLGGCSHPAAFVDPYPAFWDKMAQLALRCAAISRVQKQLGSSWHSNPLDMDRSDVFFTNFAEVMRKLEAVAIAQANHQALSKEQVDYLKAVMEGHLSSGPSRFEGWYPSLFYSSASKSVVMENQVIDFFTNPPSPMRADPGGVLHLQVSHAELSVIVVDDTMYAGPIFNHCEFIAPAGTRYVSGVYVPKNYQTRPGWVRTSFASAIQ